MVSRSAMELGDRSGLQLVRDALAIPAPYRCALPRLSWSEGRPPERNSRP